MYPLASGTSGFGGGGAYASYGPGYGPGRAASGCVPAACCGAGCATCETTCGGGIGGWTYGVVPEGRGDYVAYTAYRYVGQGAGNVSLFPVPAPRGCSCWWSLCFLWLFPLLLIPFLFFNDTTTTTTTTPFLPPITTPQPPPDMPTTTPPLPTTTPAPDTTPPLPTTTPPPDVPPGPPGICRVFGDPHVKTFDGTHASFYSAGEYWLVRSNTVWIQARYAPTPVTNGLSVVKEVAVGGPFLQSSDGTKNILRITALQATFNGQQIIPAFPDQWTNTDPNIEVVTDSSGEILQQGRQGKTMHVVHVKLPNFVELQLNRWNEPGEGDYLNVKITMPVQPQQDGHCGNFNGDPNDDTRPLIRARIGTTGVDPQFLLFRTKTPVVAPNRPDLNNCPTEKANHARDICAKASPKLMASHDCMVDVCFGGDHFATLTDYE